MDWRWERTAQEARPHPELSITHTLGDCTFAGSTAKRSPPPLCTSFAIGPLTVAMIGTPFRAFLMTAVGLPSLFAPRPKATPAVAIALSAIAGSADDKQDMAENTGAQPKGQFARIRPAGCHCRQVGLDKGDRSWQGKTIRIRF